MIDLSRARIVPYDHQRAGVEALVKLDDNARGRILPGCFALFDEMGAGKSKQVIDAAQVLFDRGDLERVLIIAPASVRTVWYDPELGELKKHLWDGIPVIIQEFHAKLRQWRQNVSDPNKALFIIITNYEFIRAQARLDQLKLFCTRKTLLVLDESSLVKNHRAAQTKACLQLRKRCGRIVLLNGTPIANNPLDMYSQGNLMDPKILGVQNFYHMRARYAVVGGFLNKQILSWQNLDDLQTRFVPYVLRRLKIDCLDLPPKLPPTTVEVALTPATWRVYKDMRDQMIAWLDAQTVAVATQAGVKAMRLAQVCAGFIGGLQDEVDSAIVPVFQDDPDRPDWIPQIDNAGSRRGPSKTPSRPVDVDPTTRLIVSDDELDLNATTREVGREKVDVFVEWVQQRLREDPNIKLLVWCWFRAQVQRAHLEINQKFPHIATARIWGHHTGQPKNERADALRLLDPRTTPAGPVIVIGTPASGSMGLNLTAANQVIYLSNDYNLKTRVQSEDRVHRPGQTKPVSYTDVIATGPNGQRTVDYTIIRALRAKENLATYTCAAWIKLLSEEAE